PPPPPPAQPQIVIQENANFGNVEVGQTAEWTLRITNEGEADLSIIALRLTPEEAEFVFDDTRLPTKWTIALGDTMELFLFFAPSSSGLQEGTVIIQSTDPDRPEVRVALSGIGAVQDIALGASQHDFGEVDIEDSGQWELVILNEGTMSLSVEQVRLKRGRDFSLETLSLPQTIEPDSTLNVPVKFTPISAGTFRDVLVVNSNDPDEKALEVRLVGTGKQQVVQRIDCPEVTRTKTYQMISIPLMMTNGSAEWVLGPVLGTYDQALWRLFRYQNDKYVEYGEGIAPFSPGRGFWLITRESVKLYAGPGRSAIANTPEGDFKITLQPGWNMIGVPFDFPVAWSQVDLGGKNVEPPVAFDGMAFRYNQTILSPWQGYAVKNLEPTTVDLCIPPIRAGKSAPSKEIGTRQPAAPPEGWTINITARYGHYEDVENTLGWLPEAREAWDAHERSEAPPIGDFVAVYFDHSDWERYPGRYTTDFRPAGMEEYVWDFVVETNAPSEEATLHWEKSLPAGMAGILIDLVHNVCVDVTQTDAYRFSFGAQDMVGEASEFRRAFRLIVGTSGFVAEEIAGASKKPDAFHLAQNAPNPFNPRTTIRFEVPDASGGAVELAVFDLLGQKVRTLASGALEAGSYELEWDGTDEMGRDVSSGVYLARLKGKGFVGVRKMVLIR
ncbi:MAG: choice-of-anchor D domain-containing protein, partial [Candidatus Latescibacteria bacterium]|nr:choice-of-anchor D domain-containing protein [Candidatus Latescibacterota bacterium]